MRWVWYFNVVRFSEFYVRGSDHVYSAQIMWVVRVICFFNMGLFGFVTLHVWNVAVWIRPGASVLGGFGWFVYMQWTISFWLQKLLSWFPFSVQLRLGNGVS